MVKKIKEKISSGAASLIIAVLSVKIIGVLYKIPLSYLLGDEGMGYFNSAYTVYGFFYIVTTTGIPKAIAILIAGHNEKANGEKAYDIYVKLFSVIGIIGAAVAALYTVLVFPLAGVIGSNKSVYAMLAIAPSVLFSTLAGVSRGFLNGKKALFPIAVSQVIEAASKLILGLALALIATRAGLGLPSVSALTILGITFGTLISAFYLHISAKKYKSDENVGQNNRVDTRKILKQVFRTAIPITVSTAVLSFSNLIDLGLIMRSLEDVGYTEEGATALYGNYTTLVIPMLNLSVALLSPIGVELLPKLVKALKSKQDNANVLVNKAMDNTLILGIPYALVLFLYPFDVLDLLFQPYPSATAAILLSVIAPSAVLLPLLNLLNTAMEACGRVMLSVTTLTLGAAVKVILSIFLLKNPDLGILGMPISTVVSYLFSFILALIFYFLLYRKSPLSGISAFILLWSAASFILPHAFMYASGLLGSGAQAMIISLTISVIVYLGGVIGIKIFSECIKRNKMHKKSN